MENTASRNATADTATVCIANIGPKERRKRLVIGAAALAVGFVLGALLIWADVPRFWRLAAFLPFLSGGISTFQVTEKTCVALAARGVRNLDDGEQAVADAAELRQLERQARRVKLLGFALATVLTAALLALP